VSISSCFAYFLLLLYENGVSSGIITSRPALLIGIVLVGPFYILVYPSEAYVGVRTGLLPNGIECCKREGTVGHLPLKELHLLTQHFLIWADLVDSNFLMTNRDCDTLQIAS
jgi:hypothetical protein